VVADPLVWISQRLCERVAVFRTIATELSLQNGDWTVDTERGEITSKNVILAVGSVPKKLAYAGLDEIPLEVALDPQKLAQQPLEGATVAVFGSSHSSMIALPNLLANPVRKVINFYQSPLRYAVYLEDWICSMTAV
jgi:thioredoxin reductase